MDISIKDALFRILTGLASTFVRAAFLFAAWPAVVRVFGVASSSFADCFFLTVAVEALAPRLAAWPEPQKPAVVPAHPDALTARALSMFDTAANK